MPGDIIACGTSLGAGTMGDAHNVVDIVIDGVGSLSNVFDQVLPSPYLTGSPPKQKKICIVGAGAIGGLLAAKFALAGEDVAVIDRARISPRSRRTASSWNGTTVRCRPRK